MTETSIMVSELRRKVEKDYFRALLIPRSLDNTV